MGPEMRAGIAFGRRKAHAATLLVAGCASLLACGLAVGSCITAPPPDLPLVQRPHPTIVHYAVQPPEGPLFEWPTMLTQFVVPVEVDGPGEPFAYNVFVDFSGDQLSGDQSPRTGGSGPINLPDGGITLVSFWFTPPETPIPCPHRIDFLVANKFDPMSPHTFDSAGGDIVTWWYYPDGGPGGCPASYTGDGAFPDASVDGLPVVPETGGGP
jgi:hypothetical protein